VLAAIVEPLLNVRRVMRQQLAVLHKMLLDTVRGNPVCRRLMTAPGVGAVVALTYRATVDQPQRFVRSRAVGAHVGLTPNRYQSGEVDYDGRVSKCGDALLRTMLYEAAQVPRPQWEMVVAEGMGHTGGSAPRDTSSDRRRRQAGAWPWFCTGCGSMVASSAGARPLIQRPEPEKSQERR
jgi:hypothetical protein